MEEGSIGARSIKASKLLRNPLRFATKPKEEKQPLVDSSNSSAHKREKLASSVSKSVGVLDLSDKKPAKPPRRQSVSSKPTASPAPRTIGGKTFRKKNYTELVGLVAEVARQPGLVAENLGNYTPFYDMKLLAVDIPMASGPDQRLFLIGDEEEYRIGGGLISELRDPVVKALAATKEFEDRDQLEDEEDAERELQEAERKHREEIEKLEKGD
ncbi:Uncharacterized protein Fot_07019 [Forsythia ovata]|uniref:Uncharacterized protein n=1 Tax=Forsythia ovata TaxID=205694 RepID=A0ABD1WYR4_9LAMI